MKIDQFFHHFYNELELNPALYPYYKLNRGSDKKNSAKITLFKDCPILIIKLIKVIILLLWIADAAMAQHVSIWQ